MTFWVRCSSRFNGQCIFITNKVTSVTINKPFKRNCDDDFRKPNSMFGIQPFGIMPYGV